MRDWNSPDELTRDASAFVKLVHGLSGFFLWEVALSMTFEWAFITGTKKFTWPAIFYFLGRYSAIATVIGSLVSIDAGSPLHCQPLYTFLAIAGQFTVGFAGINLAIRVMAIWSMSLSCVVPLVLMILGHWAVLLQGVIISATWVPGTGCSVTKTNTSMLMVSFTYTACFVFVLLVFALVKLVYLAPKRPKISTLIYHEGLQYYVIALLANIPPAVVLSLDLNPIMDVIFPFPAGIIFSSAACRSLRQLSDRKPDNSPFSDPSRLSTSLIFKSNEQGATNAPVSRGPVRRADGVHVHMDTYVVAEDNTSEYEASKKAELGNDSGDEHVL